MREMWELAQALSSLGYWVSIDTKKRTLKVYRDGVLIGRFKFPIDVLFGPEA